MIIRLFLSHFPAFESDQNAFRFWTERLAALGPNRFYSPYVFTNNPLGILYFFWLIGALKHSLFSNIITPSNIDIFLKLAANIADLAAGFVIYKMVKEKLNENAGNITAALYIFNPSFIFNSAVWGQYDSVAILFLVLSIYYCLVKKSPILCSVFFSFAWIIKPQSLELAPFLVFFFLGNFKFIQMLFAVISIAITALIAFLPFFPSNPLYGIYYVNFGSTNLFNCTTCNALNFWGIWGNWKNDMSLFLGIPQLYWGLILLAVFLIIIFLNKTKGHILYFTITISMLSFFMLLTRMHERYIAYFFPFLLLSAMILKSRIIMFFYVFFSFILLLNLYIPYAYYNNSIKITNLPVNGLSDNLSNFSLIAFLGFVLLFAYYIYYVKRHKTS